jgi:F-type H+-transporting ATPase subunit a
LVPGIIIFDLLVFLFIPPYAPGAPGAECSFPVCFINGNLEFPAPHTVWVAGGAEPMTDLMGFQVSISSTILTLWIAAVIVLLVAVPVMRRHDDVPGRLQNFAEWAWESLRDFGMSLGGPKAARYIPIFAAFFVLILFSNWTGLLPFVGKVEFLRAPTSDLNVTIGLALVAFIIIEVEGFRRLGFGGYAGKFFPFYEFKKGIGAGLIALFVGLIELLLEFVKPLTLSMRLFGNIYGGEVALGVVSALTVAILPVLLLGLEFMLNFIQALIFSVLTLMFILLAIESHEHEEGEMGHEAIDALEGHGAPQPAGAH